MEEHKTVNGFTDSQKRLKRNQFFEILKGNKVQAKLPFSWKKGFDYGVVIDKRARYCTECKKDSVCIGCVKTINQI